MTPRGPSVVSHNGVPPLVGLAETLLHLLARVAGAQRSWPTTSFANGLVLESSLPDENARAARAFNAALAANPPLTSIILPIMRTTIDGIAISLVN